jgi:hypothetical protein
LRTRNIVILLIILALLGGIYFVFNRPEPAPKQEPKEYVWMIEQDNIEHITITLLRENPQLSQSFIKISKGDAFPWFFDDPPKYSSVNSTRWGGGIPLLLSGPGADRVITYNATPEQLTEFGFGQPKMKIDLILADNTTMTIYLGDATPDGSNYYIRAPNSDAVATVDYTWYNEMERLLKDPPYATPTPTAKS